MKPFSFRYVSPDPTCRKNDLPTTPFWHVEDILSLARMVLRRKTSTAVTHRAELLVERFAAFRDYLHQIGVEQEGDCCFDDAGDLEWLIDLPERSHYFRRSIEDELNDAPWPGDAGWLLAEDLAVLALMKVDDFFAMVAGGGECTPESFSSLLDAYRSCVLAVRRGGLAVVTEEEQEEAIHFFGDLQRRQTSLARRKAAGERSSQKLKELVVQRYLELRQEPTDRKRPRRNIALMIAKEYEEGVGLFAGGHLREAIKEGDGGNRPERFYKWILNIEKEYPSS